jgi:hypothetical protein
LRDSLLSVSGNLDCSIGGPPVPFGEKNFRRTVYALIGRTKPDPVMALFDFPNPNGTSEQRMVTVGPMQRLYLMNNGFVTAQARATAERVGIAGSDEDARIRRAYELLFGRPPTASEIALGTAFVKESGWAQYMQVLLSSAEFSSVN